MPTIFTQRYEEEHIHDPEECDEGCVETVDVFDPDEVTDAINICSGVCDDLK